MIRRHVLSALAIIVLTCSLALAQAPAAGGGQRAGGPPPPMKNLQVLPKETPQPQVVAMMRVFNAALGVNCDHCHVWTKPGDPSNDMAADSKATKAVAREMQENAWNFVPHLYFGQWTQPVAHRANIRNWIPVPEVVPFWNVEKG